MLQNRKTAKPQKMTKNYLFLFYVGYLFLGVFGRLSAQNLTEISTKKGITFTGGSINANLIGYASTGIANRRDPFNYFLSGSVGIQVFGYSVPFSFSYSNTGKNFSQPFNQFVFSPEYKWVKTYIGTTSMTFSPYTLAGHVFSGAGVELSPKKWRIGVMVGRLRKAVQFNLQEPIESANNQSASFKRMGYALKLGYEGSKGALSGSILYAKDDENSVTTIPFGTNLTPQQNIAVNFKAKKTFFKKLSAEMEYAISVINNNTKVSSDTVLVGSNFLGNLLPNNATRQSFDAFSGSLGYSFKKISIQLKYERIAPEYKSLGAYFFNNDMENITIAPTFQLANGKINVAANVGIQKNNLNQLKITQTQRFVSNLNVSFAPTDKINTSLTYSNFSNYTRIRPLNDPYLRVPTDSLNFFQISDNFDGNASYAFGSKEMPKSITLSASYQKAKDKNNGSTGDNLNEVYNGNFAFSQGITKEKIQISSGVNYFLNNNSGISSSFIGPNLNVSKNFVKSGLQLACSNAYNANFTTVSLPTPTETITKKTFNDVWNTRISLNYKIKAKKVEVKEENKEDKKISQEMAASTGKDVVKTPKKRPQTQTISFSFQRMQRFKGTQSQPAFTEYTATLNYTYSF